eukprot:706541-Rhodomonas_salina.1
MARPHQFLRVVCGTELVWHTWCAALALAANTLALAANTGPRMRGPPTPIPHRIATRVRCGVERSKAADQVCPCPMILCYPLMLSSYAKLLRYTMILNDAAQCVYAHRRRMMPLVLRRVLRPAGAPRVCRAACARSVCACAHVECACASSERACAHAEGGCTRGRACWTLTRRGSGACGAPSPTCPTSLLPTPALQ